MASDAVGPVIDCVHELHTSLLKLLGAAEAASRPTATASDADALEPSANELAAADTRLHEALEQLLQLRRQSILRCWSENDPSYRVLGPPLTSCASQTTDFKLFNRTFSARSD